MTKLHNSLCSGSENKSFVEDFFLMETKYKKSKYYSTAKEQADIAKAVMFRENLEVIFDRYRISEDKLESKRRVELAEAVNKDDFQRVLRYLAKYIDVDAISSNITPELYTYLREEELESFFREEVLPTLLSSPNSLAALIPVIEEGVVYLSPEIIELEYISYTDGNTLIFKYDEDLYVYMSSMEVFSFNRDGIYMDSLIAFDSPVNLFFELGGIKRMVYQNNRELPRYCKTIYESFFDGAIGKSVMACRIASDKELTRMRSAHPLIAMKRMPCNTCNATGCDNCGQSGYVEPAPSMGSVFYFSEADVMDNNNGGNEIDNIIKYLQPPLEAVAVQREEYLLHSNECKEALNFVYINEAQSGVAKMIDREDKRISSTTILRVVYRVMEDMLTSIGLIKQTSSIPVRFDLPKDLTSDSYDILNHISELKEKGLSETLLLNEYESYYRTVYAEDPVKLKLYLWALEADPYFIYSKEEKPLGYVFTFNILKSFNTIIQKYGEDILSWTDRKFNKILTELIEHNGNEKENN